MYIDLNAASAEEFEKLPYIGEKMAMRIVECRRVNGPLPDGPINAAGQKHWGRYAIKSCAIIID